MDTVTLVDSHQIDDGKRLLDRLGDNGFVARAACWAKPADEDRWSLYIASPVVEEKGALAAYREVLGALRDLVGVRLTSSDVKLIGEMHPVARDVLDILRGFPGTTWARRSVLGGMPVDGDVYVYPPGKGTRVEIPIYGLTFRGEPGGVLHLSFEPHRAHSVTVEGLDGRHEYPAQTGIDWAVAAPEGAALARDDIGRMALAWNLGGRRMLSTANEVWSLAKLGLHGFRFLREPSPPDR